jgi:hypothetical protein
MFLMISVFIHGEKVAVIGEVLKPATISVDDTQFYVTEGALIFIYSLKDYTLVKKFGKEGQGPQEFAVVPQLPIALNVNHKNIIVNSLFKISYFTKNGSFIKEIKTKATRSFIFVPLKEGFVGMSQIFPEGVVYNIVNIFDAELNRGVEIARMKVGNPEKKIVLLKQTLAYQTHDNKIFVTGEKGFVINVFDHTGEKLYSITQEYERIKFAPKFEKEIREAFKKQDALQYEYLKNKLEFPDYFPPISSFFIDNNKVYAGTYNLQGDTLEFYIFSLKGKLLKKQFVTFSFIEGSLQPYPLTMKNGKLYQLIENEEEEWELHVSKFE